MIRWLKIARAEIVRDLKTSLRYPLELGTGIFILYVLFMGMFLGAKVIAGRASTALSGNLDGLVIGFVMWFAAMMAINSVSTDIEYESRQGTLEQVYIHAPSFIGLTWMRAVTHISLGLGAVIFLALLIQLTTQHWLHLTWATLPATILVFALTIAGLCGFGLILGGLSMVLKRIGQLSALVQFSMLFLAYAVFLPEPWRSVVAHLPLAGGVFLLKKLFTPGASFADVAGGTAWLALDSAVYVVIGTLVFAVMERLARKCGMLGHY